MTELTALVGRVRAGRGGADEMVATFRDTIVYVPTDRTGDPVAGTVGDIAWLYAFTSREELSRWAVARGEGGTEVRYLTTRGHRLLDAPATRPTGVALDVAGTAPMLLPPVPGVVSEDRAVRL